jgi:Protein of unknown function (DUF2846)
MVRKFVAVMAVLSLLVMSGCASVPMASKSADAQAKLFAPVTDKATVYIYRNGIFGSAIKLPLLIDGASVGDTAPKTYVEQVLPPGSHTITSKGEKDSSLTLAVEAGQTYYVKQEVVMGVFAASTELHAVDEKTGRAAVSECRLIQTTNTSYSPANVLVPTPAAPVASASTPAMAAPVEASSIAASTPGSVAPAPESGGLASLDKRVTPLVFNAAQNVAAIQQCDRMIHVQSMDGAHALFYTACPAGRAALHIECSGVQCAPQL